MTIITCPNCYHEIQSPVRLPMDRTISCPRCKKEFSVKEGGQQVVTKTTGVRLVLMWVFIILSIPAVLMGLYTIYMRVWAIGFALFLLGILFIGIAQMCKAKKK